MATLSADTVRVFDGGIGPETNSLAVIASDIIYRGAAVGESSSTGTFRPLAAADTFAGFAEAKADNSSGSAAAINVQVRQRGIVKLTVTGGAANANVGEKVYASDDDTFTTTSSGNSLIGKIIRWTSGTTNYVQFEASYLDSGV